MWFKKEEVIRQKTLYDTYKDYFDKEVFPQLSKQISQDYTHIKIVKYKNKMGSISIEVQGYDRKLIVYTIALNLEGTILQLYASVKKNLLENKAQIDRAILSVSYKGEREHILKQIRGAKREHNKQLRELSRLDLKYEHKKKGV